MLNQEFIGEFIEEAILHVQEVETILLKDTETRSSSEEINTLFRAVHSLKGTAGFIGLNNLVELSHAMENIFGDIRTGKYVLSDKIVDVMLEANDFLKNMIENIAESDKMHISAIVSKVAKLANIDEAEDSEKHYYVLKDSKNKSFTFTDSNAILIDEAIEQEHKMYQLKLGFNKDLLNYADGPIKLFNKIEASGRLIDTITDHNEIGSLYDVLSVVTNEEKDVYLSIFISTFLDLELIAYSLNIPEANVHELTVEKCIASEGVVKVCEIKPSAEASFEATSEANEKSEEAPEQNTKATKSQAIKIDESIRINANILNELLDMAGEMVLGRNQLLRTLQDYRQSIPGLPGVLQHIDKLTSKMQEKIMQARMQPVANVFSKFPRMIRDIAKKLSKEIDLTTDDAGVELDKSMIEALSEPLTHLVRNSADHGIELPDVRAKAGKDKKGSILLRAVQEGGYVNIEVIDDGAGINAERIKQKAIEKSIISKQELEKMSENEVLGLIFTPGFSTAEKVSDVSGRGVGMDVVKTNIEAIGGTIVIESTVGKGTTITLKLPLTLAIIDGMNLRVGTSRYIIPTTTIKESFKPNQSDIISDSEGNEMIMIRGDCIPIIRLGKLYSVNADAKNISDGIILVVESDDTTICLAADELLGEQQVVVKALPKYLKKVRGVAGCTLIGDGTISLILDIVGIMKLQRDKKFQEIRASVS